MEVLFFKPLIQKRHILPEKEAIWVYILHNYKGKKSLDSRFELILSYPDWAKYFDNEYYLKFIGQIATYKIYNKFTDCTNSFKYINRIN